VSRARDIALRLYGDYVQRERLDDLEALLRTATERGYRTMTLSAFAERVASNPPGADERILLLRHDVDTDVPRARRMWQLEHAMGLVGTWFFRRRTWDVDLMREMLRAGCEVGYHYEELADVVKERGATGERQARELFGVARTRLATTLAELRASSGLPLDVLVAHGDWANRACGVSNVELLADRAFREEIDVRLEGYDVETHVSARSSDGALPTGWSPEDPAAAILRDAPIVAVLLHPRSWGGAPAANAREDLVRLREEIAYRLRRARRRS
jgi:hypothetical protein